MADDYHSRLEGLDFRDLLGFQIHVLLYQSGDGLDLWLSEIQDGLLLLLVF